MTDTRDTVQMRECLPKRTRKGYRMRRPSKLPFCHDWRIASVANQTSTPATIDEILFPNCGSILSTGEQPQIPDQRINAPRHHIQLYRDPNSSDPRSAVRVSISQYENHGVATNLNADPASVPSSFVNQFLRPIIHFPDDSVQSSPSARDGSTLADSRLSERVSDLFLPRPRVPRSHGLIPFVSAWQYDIAIEGSLAHQRDGHSSSLDFELSWPPLARVLLHTKKSLTHAEPRPELYVLRHSPLRKRLDQVFLVDPDVVCREDFIGQHSSTFSSGACTKRRHQSALCEYYQEIGSSVGEIEDFRSPSQFDVLGPGCLAVLGDSDAGSPAEADSKGKSVQRVVSPSGDNSDRNRLDRENESPHLNRKSSESVITEVRKCKIYLGTLATTSFDPVQIDPSAGLDTLVYQSSSDSDPDQNPVPDLTNDSRRRRNLPARSTMSITRSVPGPQEKHKNGRRSTIHDEVCKDETHQSYFRKTHVNAAQFNHDPDPFLTLRNGEKFRTTSFGSSDTQISVIKNPSRWSDKPELYRTGTIKTEDCNSDHSVLMYNPGTAWSTESYSDTTRKRLTTSSKPVRSPSKLGKNVYPQTSPFEELKTASTVKTSACFKVRHHSIKIGRKSGTVAVTTDDTLAGTRDDCASASPFAKTIAMLQSCRIKDRRGKQDTLTIHACRAQAGDAALDDENSTFVPATQSWMSRFASSSRRKRKYVPSNKKKNVGATNWFRSLAFRDTSSKNTGSASLASLFKRGGRAIDVSRDESFNRKWFDQGNDEAPLLNL